MSSWTEPNITFLLFHPCQLMYFGFQQEMMISFCLHPDFLHPVVYCCLPTSCHLPPVVYIPSSTFRRLHPLSTSCRLHLIVYIPSSTSHCLHLVVYILSSTSHHLHPDCLLDMSTWYVHLINTSKKSFLPEWGQCSTSLSNKELKVIITSCIYFIAPTYD